MAERDSHFFVCLHISHYSNTYVSVHCTRIFICCYSKSFALPDGEFCEWKGFFGGVKISMKFVPKGPIIDNNKALTEIMAWRRIGDKSLSEPMLTRFTDACMRHQGRMN